MAEQTNITATTTPPAYDMASLASALIATSDALNKVNRRICFLGEMLGDKGDGLKLSSSSFDALQEFLLETVTMARTALNNTTMDYCLAKDIWGEATKKGAD